MIAKIAVSAAPFAIDKPYSYRIPQGMRLSPGVRVTVPFGRGNRRTEGVVLSVEGGSEEGLKAVDTCLDTEPLISESMLRLAAFLRERCFCTLYECLRAMLPAPLWFRTKNTYSLTDDRSWQEKGCRQSDASIILNRLQELGGEALVVATGGMAVLIAEESKVIDKLDGLLTLKGLRLIYERNKA